MQTPQPNFYVTGGAVQASNGYYVRRSADVQLLNACRAGRFAYVLTARQVGKSSLRVATAHELAQVNIRCVQIDLSGSANYPSAVRWYHRIVSQIDRQLGLQTNLRQWWQAQTFTTYGDLLTAYLAQIVLPQIDTQLVIFIDEVDATKTLSFTDDLFVTIRRINDLRATDQTFKRLSFVLLGAATPTELFSNPAQTPFNVGERIQLNDFTLAEMQPLGQGLGLSTVATERVLGFVHAWTGGHPYLTQRLCKAIALAEERGSSAEFVANITKKIFLRADRLQDDNLQFVQHQLTHPQVPPALLATYRDIRHNRHPVIYDATSLTQEQLLVTGVARIQGRELVVRNPIYAQAFGEQWLTERGFPPPAKQSGWFRWLIILLFILIGLLSLWWWQNDSTAQTLVTTEPAPISTSLPTVALTIQSQLPTATLTIPITPTAVETILPLQAVERIGTGRKHAIAHHPQQPQAAIASTVGVYVIDVETLAVVVHLDPQQAYQTVAYSADGTQLVAATAGQIALWETDRWAEPTRWQGHEGTISALVFTPNALTNSFYSSSMTGEIKVWEAASQTVLRELTALEQPVWDLAVNASWLGVAAQDAIYVWDVASGNLERRLTHCPEVREVAFSPNGQRLVGGTQSGEVCEWETTAWQLIRSLAYEGMVRDVTYSADNQQVIATGTDWTTQAWATTNPFESNTTETTITDAEFFMPFGGGGWIRGTGYANIQTEEQEMSGVHVTGGKWLTSGWGESLSFAPDGSHLLVGVSNGTVIRLQTTEPIWRTEREFADTGGVVNAVALQETYYAVAVAEGRIWVRDRRTHAVLGHLDIVGAVIDVAFSADSTFLAALTEHNELVVWDTQQWEQWATVPLTQIAHRITFAPTSNQLAVVGSQIAFWEIATMSVTQQMDTTHWQTAYGAAFSADGSTFATVGDDANLNIWQTSDYTLQQTIPVDVDASAHKTIALSPDGRWVAVTAQTAAQRAAQTDAGSPVLLIDLRDKSSVHLLAIAGLSNEVMFSADSTQLAIATENGSIQVWDVQTQTQRYAGNHALSVSTVHFLTPDTLLTGSIDGTLRIWHMTP